MKEKNELAMGVISNYNDKIAAIAKCLTVKQQERIALYLLDLINPDMSIPQEKTNSDGDLLQLDYYNWLEDRVYYYYFRPIVRWFKNETSAKDAIKDHNSYAGTREETNEYNIKAEIDVKYGDSCSLENWCK